MNLQINIQLKSQWHSRLSVSFFLLCFLHFFLTNEAKSVNSTTTIFHAGVHTLTQFGLNDARTRYQNYIDRFIQDVETSRWPDYSQGIYIWKFILSGLYQKIFL